MAAVLEHTACFPIEAKTSLVRRPVGDIEPPEQHGAIREASFRIGIRLPAPVERKGTCRLDIIVCIDFEVINGWVKEADGGQSA